jgi:DNA repair protein RadA
MSDSAPKEEKNRVLITDDIYKQIRSKLLNAGYTSPRELAIPTIFDIAKKLQVNPYEAEQYSTWALHRLEKSHVFQSSFFSANEMYLSKKEQPKLSTGCKDLDNILSGGIEQGSLTELYGSSATGKTQLCFTLSVIVQQSKAIGGLDGKAIYIDTENKFSPERILEIAAARSLDTLTTLKNIDVVNSINSTAQEKAIENISHVAQTDGKIKLVIVDSIINHYRQEFIGRQNLSERQSR